MLSDDAAIEAAAALHRAGRLAEAAAAYGEILRRTSDHADALHLSGVIAAQQGRFGEAVASMAQAVAIAPQAAAYRANLLKALSRLDERQWGGPLATAADALLDVNRPQAAARLYRAVSALHPEIAAVWYNGAVACRDSGQPAAAERGFARAGCLAFLPRAHVERGALALARGDADAALQSFLTATSGGPDDIDAWRGAANAAKSLGDQARARRLYRAATVVAPADVLSWFNGAVVCADLHLFDQAVTAGRRAATLAPDFADARYNLAHCLLMLGRLAEGWREFEHRFQAGIRVEAYDRPRWQGEDPAGKTVLLQAEQGHGDTLQFIRYAPLLAARGARVLVECPPPLQRLMAAVRGVSAVFSPGAATGFDLTCPMMSLPWAFNTTLADIPADIPYLADRFPGDERFDRFFDDDDDGALRVGLAWSGDPRPGDLRLFRANQRRSIPLADFTPLFDAAPDVRFYSLQLGAARGQAHNPPFDQLLTDPMEEVEDFADTASIIRRLDLVITVDTSVAHLVGGVGKPVWVLSRYDGCWRWLMDRDDSPWYRDCRVFRQQRFGEWGPPIKAAAAALRKVAVQATGRKLADQAAGERGRK
jgi:tetratricopeptide (TPR) repeat protein